MNKINNEQFSEKVELIVDSCKKNIIYYEEGNELINYCEKGDVIVNIQPSYHNDYIIFNRYNLIFKKKINLENMKSNYLFHIEFFEKTVLKIKINDKINLNKLYRINKKGLIKNNEKRGDLFIKFCLTFDKEEDDEIIKNNLEIKEIELTNKNSIDEYNYIMNNENYNDF